MTQEDFPFFNIESLEPVAPLLQKLLTEEPLSEGEQQLLQTWKNSSPENQALFDRLQDPEAVQAMLKTWHGIELHREMNKQRGLSRIRELMKPAAPLRNTHPIRRRWLRYAAAVVLLGTAAYFWITQRNTDRILVHRAPAAATDVIAPGRDGAVLTLADGSEVVLDSIANGIVANQNGVQVFLRNGQLGYDPTGTVSGQIAWNTISTPKGRQFRLLLPDGSKVWLNAASVIKYPTAFTGEERRVTLEGEAYFEVARNARMPFRVALSDATNVEVLGTSFNINAYRNEAGISTTLLEGAVKLHTRKQSQTLKPGQQAVLKRAGEQLTLVPDADIDKAMAWKNGLFNFEDASLEEVMRQLERWYDIEVTYAKGVPAIRFGGEINKQNTLQDVLLILERSNVHFRLEQGRKLVVMP
ncbi:FecR family protein [Chitinophaga sp. XS-30]|uniref:FecR family protein n=1 Tax=Chitinophaga sp. XS-30 TaxID=2604421 RepID=UPI0011DE535A|nr:FecR family protein [Chitinophaga sp. XS-30]QEH42481.1 DUF4974 domain-containing protein [Chitinophaga sp. XS-30]